MKKPIFKKLMGLALFASALILLDACYPQGAEFVDELDLVRTDFNSNYPFKDQVTFAINDDIPEIGTDPEDPEFVSPIRATVIITTILSNMEDRGFERVELDEDPDIYLTVAALENKTTVISCGGWWDYWGGWYYPPAAGCWYPVGYSYSTGSIFITLWDEVELNGPDDDSVAPKWSVAINGLLQGSESSINARIQNSIDQAFAQSPYILSED